MDWLRKNIVKSADKTAVIYKDKSYSYGELDKYIERYYKELKKK